MKPQWLQRPEGGSPLGLRLIRSFALGFGRAPARLLLYPVTAYFLARRGPERRASRAYLARVLGRPATLRDVARHVHCFSCTTLDRVFLLSERFRRFDIRAYGLDQLDRALAMGGGVLLFGSHLGSFDALRVLSLERPEVPVRILLDVEQGPALTAILNALNPALAATIINARRGGPAVAIAIKEALDSNAIVAVLVDRAQVGNAVTSAQFLGQPAPFPTSPWLLAATLKAPVILSFGLYRGGNRYDLHFETFADRIVAERRDRAAAVARLVQQFADRLAHYARLAPYNWFNFYDFWHGDAHSEQAENFSDGAKRVDATPIGGANNGTAHGASGASINGAAREVGHTSGDAARIASAASINGAAREVGHTSGDAARIASAASINGVAREVGHTSGDAARVDRSTASADNELVRRS